MKHADEWNALDKQPWNGTEKAAFVLFILVIGFGIMLLMK